MIKKDCDVQRKLKVQRSAEKTGHAARTCRYWKEGAQGSTGISRTLVRNLASIQIVGQHYKWLPPAKMIGSHRAIHVPR